MKQGVSQKRMWPAMLAMAAVCVGLGWGGNAVFGGKRGSLWHVKPASKQIAPVMVYDLSPLVSKLKPAVFNLAVSGVRPNANTRSLWFYRQNRRKFKSKGSGFLINAKGYALTNYHVVRYANHIVAEMADKRTYQVKVIGKSPELDVALIRLVGTSTTKFPFVYLGNSHKVLVGEPAIAIGNARGLGFSVTAGIVSAKGRALNGLYENYLQTDAAINHGNSGGPLFNKHGEVIGINTAILRGGRGIGFAVPINIVKQIIPQLKSKGVVQRAELGVEIQRITPELARSYHLEAPIGALVTNVVQGSPAERAGIRISDVIISFNGQPVNSYSDLPRLVAFNPPGSLARLTVIRNRKRIQLKVRLVRKGLALSGMPRYRRYRQPNAAPSPFAPAPRSVPDTPPSITRGQALRRLGVGVRSVTASQRKRLGLDDGGVTIVTIAASSPAGQNGLRRGDVIVEVNRTPVRSTRHFLELIRKVRKGDSLLLLVRRANSALFLSFPLP